MTPATQIAAKEKFCLGISYFCPLLVQNFFKFILKVRNHSTRNKSRLSSKVESCCKISLKYLAAYFDLVV
jgi:hypothetical protein